MNFLHSTLPLLRFDAVCILLIYIMRAKITEKRLNNTTRTFIALDITEKNCLGLRKCFLVLVDIYKPYH